VNGPIVYSYGLMEVMLMGSGLTYPKHKHSSEEVYIVLAGKVWWEAENVKSSPAWKNAGDVIHHAPNQIHAVTAGDEPVLILNLWRGGSFEMPEIV
jgi:quercetin dioxygenase-like cupin family protein